jgi:hypothetical protein
MNGQLSPFKKAVLNMPTFEVFAKTIRELKDIDGVEDAKIRELYDQVSHDDVYMNDEYQVNINRNHMWGLDIVVWHLSIKRLDKEAIHDWRDLQNIKNMLVGEEYEAVEIYPSESRLVDSANQYHLWAFVKLIGRDEIPTLPIGFPNRYVTDTPDMPNCKQRKF